MTNPRLVYERRARASAPIATRCSRVCANTFDAVVEALGNVR
jgi:hypothetical protein